MYLKFIHAVLGYIGNKEICYNFKLKRLYLKGMVQNEMYEYRICVFFISGTKSCCDISVNAF